MNNPILEYYQQIKTGEVTVGKFIRLWYEQVVRGLEERRWTYSQKKAAAAIRFIENFMHHHEGALAPGLLKLELWQKATLAVIFGIMDDEGRRQFREIVIIIGRKNGKTLLAAGIAEYCAFLGDYGGRIYFAAPKLDQAALCFDAMYQAILQEPELDALAKKRRSDIYIQQNNTTIRPLAFNARTSDGLNISLAICDELAAWRGDPGLKFYEVLSSSMGARREPLLISITTAGYENNGIYDELVKRCTRVLLGGSKEQRLAPFLYTIDDLAKWNDITELQKSNPNMGVSISVDYLIEQIAIAEGSLSKKAEFIAKHGNIKQNSTTAWLSAQTVEKAFSDEPLDPESFRGCYAVGGIDLSRTTDLTACCAVIEKDGVLNVLAHFFLPAEKITDAIERDGLPYMLYVERGLLTLSGENFVDYNDCFRWFRDLVEKYEILPLKTGYDRYSANYLVQDMSGYGFHMDDVYQGENLSPVIDETEGLIKDGRICIGDNDLLKIHMLDSAIKINAETSRKKLIKVSSKVHIDGTASLLDSLTVRQKWYTEIGSQLANE
jgi:phage terminase large subunit-like protein